MKKMISLSLAALMLLSVLPGCSGGSSTSDTAVSGANAAGASNAAAASASGEKMKIGYACINVNDTNQSHGVAAAKKYAAANNIDLTVVDAQNDAATQQDQIKTFITQGCKAIVVIPADVSGMATVTAAGKAANIPIVYLNQDPYPKGDFPQGAYYVGSQDATAGKMQADYIGAKLQGKGNVCILEGKLDNQPTIQRTAAIEQELKAKYPNIKVLAKEAGDWQRDKAMDVTQNWLTTYGTKINAVLANNDEMALGAILALKGAGQNSTLVMGIDGIADGVSAVKAGTMSATVYQAMDKEAETALKVGVEAAKGGNPQQITWIDWQLITKENAK